MARKSEIDGLPVIDAKRHINLVVIDNDINKASRKNPLDCAVARACRRDLHIKEVKVHKSRIYLRSNKGNWQRYIVPVSLKAEIISLDRGGSFAPGEYTLLAPPKQARLTGKQQGSTTGQTKKKGKKVGSRRSYHITADVRTGPYAD